MESENAPASGLPEVILRAMTKRTYGTGSLLVRAGSYHGQWRVDRRLVKRKLGLVRQPGAREGLTRAQAERALRRAIEEVSAAPTSRRVDVQEAGEQLLAHLAGLGRKPSTLQGYESFLRIHLEPFFGGRDLEKIGRTEVEAFVAACRRNGQSVKSTRNYLGLLHSIFDFAQKRGHVTQNPCKLVDKPQAVETDPDIRFLDQCELDALLAAVPQDALGAVERRLYLAAGDDGDAAGRAAGSQVDGRRLGRAAHPCAAQLRSR